jgi:hypothetical protein
MNGSAAIAKSCAFFALLALGVAQKRVSESQTLQSFRVLSRRGSSQSNKKRFTEFVLDGRPSRKPTA